MVPESFGANAKQAPEFEALQQTDDNEFLVLFSQHQEQEQSQVISNGHVALVKIFIPFDLRTF